MRRFLGWAAIIGGAVFLALQLVPYGWRHPNPPVVAEPPWPDVEAEALARDACYDCHSNQTDWPFYSYVAPMSWLVRSDVETGRDELNFSEWEGDADDAADTIAEGSMPPTRYTILHSDARLSSAEEQQLIAALEAIDDVDDNGDDGGGENGDGEDGSGGNDG